MRHVTEAAVPRLLYVEDDPIVALAIQTVLEDAGYEVHHVPDGKTALSALDESGLDYQGLITDVRLPDLLGWEVAQHARAINHAIPVVYVSGDSAADWAVEGVPNSLMLEKPFANAQLVAAITTLLNEAAARPSS